jgi:diadenosine tetraphosphate (Ap4A) HIT family hydrolase
MTTDWKKDRVGSAERGENPLVLTRIDSPHGSNWAVIGDTQFLPGYCVLNCGVRRGDEIPNHLSDLPLPARTQFLADMSLLGEAIMRACLPLRVNYSVYGNADHFLHAHVFPRYDWEDAARVKMPPWLYTPDHWSDPQFAYSSDQHGELRAEIKAALLDLMAAKD